MLRRLEFAAQKIKEQGVQKEREERERLRFRICTRLRFWLSTNSSTMVARQGQLLGEEILIVNLGQTFPRAQMRSGII